MYCCCRTRSTIYGLPYSEPEPPVPAPEPEPEPEPEAPPPLNTCDWCDANLDQQIAYTLRTQHIGDKSSIKYQIGECCVLSGDCATYTQDFVDAWGHPPNLKFSFLATADNVTQMFEAAERNYAAGGCRHATREMFRSAWRTFKKLTRSEQALVNNA